MKRIIGENNILNLLYEFDDVFPRNKERVGDYVGWAKKISDFGTVIVNEQEDTNIGMCVYYANDTQTRKGYISLIGIKQPYRGIGEGRILLNSVIENMKENGMSCVLLEVDDDNNAAFCFYERMGFVIEQKRENTYLLKYSWAK